MHNVSTLGSVNLGRYNGLPIRLHVSCLLVGVFVFFFSTQSTADPSGHTGFILFVWLGCVLLHEAGHCFAVNRMGGTNEMLVLTPFGGLSFQSFPQQAGKDLWIALSGPLLSFIGFIIAFGILWSVEANPLPGLFGIDQGFFSASAVVIGLRLTIWINLTLTVLNLLPTIPFDGGWILHAVLWPTLGDELAWQIVRKASLATATGLLLLAIAVGQMSFATVPLWLPLAIISVYCFCFSAVPLSVPFGSTSDESSHEDLSPMTGKPHQQLKTDYTDDDPELFDTDANEESLFLLSIEQTQSQQSRQEDSVVDEILQCVYDRGLNSLTQAQHKILRDAAIRYRARAPK